MNLKMISRLFIRATTLTAMAAAVMYMEGCDMQQATFTGQILNSQAQPLSGVIITVNDQKVETDKEGTFRISIDSTGQYLVKARKEKFSTYTQRFTRGAENIKIILYDATLAVVDPTQDIVVTDTQSANTPGPAASDAVWTPGNFSSLPLVYENGKVVDFGFTPNLKSAFDYIVSRKQAGPGITISIPANSLSRGGQRPSGKVNVSLSTVDLFTMGAMPGDMSVRRADGSRGGFMVSFGAGSIEIYDEEGEYQLNEKAKATISIPVDSSVLLFNREIPQTVPLFYYDEATGFWVEQGKATLNAAKNMYEASLEHFSSFNMDIEKNTPACLQIRHNSVGVSTVGTYKVEAVLTYLGNVIHQERTIIDPGPNPAVWPVGDPNPCLTNGNNTSMHMLYNLPETTEVCLIFYEQVGATFVPISIAVTTTGATYGTTLPTCPSATCPGACANDCVDASCGGYGTCTFVPFNKITNEVLLASKLTTPTNIRFKWVLNKPAAVITYEIYETDFIGNILTPGSPVHTVTLPVTDNPMDPKEANVTVAAGSPAAQHFFKVVTTSGGSPYGESAFVDLTY
jgi:hypothetical protein